jgi:glycosyltransferase involved in cell wall biosynthesis
MRIAVLSCRNRQVGGIEEYVRTFLLAAAESGNEVGFWYETDEPRNCAAIPDPPAGGWSIAALGPQNALGALREWQPDVIYGHGLVSPAIEIAVCDIAPVVFFAHVYHGTCISGSKTTWFPVASPCQRRFGPACLAHYFPRRCGGLNPLTMWRQHRVQSDRLAAIRRCAAVVTHSEHMRDEYLRNGIRADRVMCLPFYIPEPAAEELPPRAPGLPATLLFLGRMEAPKGGMVLLDAMPRVRRALARPVRLLLAGDGRSRPAWEKRAAALQARDPGLRIEFPGWIDDSGRGALFQEADLLVVPSIWPEPFGRIGPEAGMYGVPAAAFAVGGIPSWLTDGVNGFLAPGDPPTASGLAGAITRCLDDPARHRELRTGASRLASRFRWASHYRALMAVLKHVARDGGSRRPGAELDVEVAGATGCGCPTSADAEQPGS